jgi:hypothetical protein
MAMNKLGWVVAGVLGTMVVLGSSAAPQEDKISDRLGRIESLLMRRFHSDIYKHERMDTCDGGLRNGRFDPILSVCEQAESELVTARKCIEAALKDQALERAGAEADEARSILLKQYGRFMTEHEKAKFQPRKK